MGSSGSMAAASISLKNNRAQLNRKTFKNLKSLYKTSYSKEKPKFKEVSKEELLVIKKEIQEKAITDRRKLYRKTGVLFFLSLVVIFILAYSLFR